MLNCGAKHTSQSSNMRRLLEKHILHLSDLLSNTVRSDRLHLVISISFLLISVQCFYLLLVFTAPAIYATP